MRFLVLLAAIVAAALVATGSAWATPSPGLVAAYGFDEGAGSVISDASGNDHVGTIAGGATWAPGRFGSALRFDGVSANVYLGALGTFYRTGFTFEAWVQKTSATKNDVAVLGSWTSSGGGPMIWVDHVATRYQLTMNQGLSNYLDSTQNPVAGQWQHLAATYDGSTARFYIDGALVASRSVNYDIGTSNTWRIGAYDASPFGFFDGLIDDVRIYDRPLGAAEIHSDMTQPVSLSNAGAPTAPGSLTATRTKTSLSAQWAAATDDHGVAGYTVYLDGAVAGTVTGTSYTASGLTCSTSHKIEVEAYDADSNVSSKVALTASTALCNGVVGMVASYRLDEGSGSTVGDASGNAHTGAIAGATWQAGKNGSALAFNGTSAAVDLGSLGTFYKTAFTMEAWIKKTSTQKDVAVVGSWTGSAGGPMIWIDHVVGHYRLTFDRSMSGYLDSGVEPATGRWQHVAATFDGTTARFYVDGAEVASMPVSGAVGNSDSWRIGAYGSSPTGFFDGGIDDVRIYGRALSAAEIAVDMNQPVPAPDTTPPSAPATLTATPGLGSATLSWSAATDDSRVDHYDVYRARVDGFAPSAATKIGQSTTETYLDSSASGGDFYYRVIAVDPAGNAGAPSPQATASTLADTTAPTVSLTAPNAGSVSGTVGLAAAASDNQAVAGVQFRVDGHDLGTEDTTAPYAGSWDTREALNGPHTLTAVARDGSGNTTTSAAVSVNVANAGVSATGLRAAYDLDEGSGLLAGDASGNARTGTLSTGASWQTAGRFGGGLALDGAGGHVDLPPLGTFYKTGFTYEAWVYKQSAKTDVAVMGSWVGSQNGGAMIWVDHLSGHYRLTLGNSIANYVDSGRTPAVGRWQHVAATYDGTTARIYIDGVVAASGTYTGNVGDANTWRIGAYGAPAGGFFDGSVDDVRLYDRALTPSEIALDMTARVQPERTAPTVAAVTPADGITTGSVTTTVTARFSEQMLAASLTTSTFTLVDDTGAAVPATVSYDAASSTATLAPVNALDFAHTYRATLTGNGATDLAGNSLGAAISWSFATETSPPPILVVSSPSNQFGSYLEEILRSEGLSDFTQVDVGFLTPAMLADFDVVVLGDTELNSTQVSALTSWVAGGGNLVAMRPDKLLAPLLGITDANSTLTNGYLKVDPDGPGGGIVTDSIQFHGTADLYTTSGATTVATLWSDATTPTTSPAVTMHDVGTNGGQAAAFTFDLARSVVYTRQGNPAWAGQERDGVIGVRPSDLFYGAKPGDVQPDWVDTSKIQIPQADEEQRLLVNLITRMERDRLPLPRFWYLPRGAKAAVVLSGDDHAPTQAPGGTASNFDRFAALSPPGCSVPDWECVRSTSYIYPYSALTNAQAAAYTAQGFELALHPVVATCTATPPTGAAFASALSSQLIDFEAKYTSVPAPVSSRSHCVVWPDWASVPKAEFANGIRMDANYYHYPGSWLATKPGFINGGGFPMRFADTDGTTIDVFQENTTMVDETFQPFPATVDTLLDNAIGPSGFYGAFGVNIHTDENAPQADYEAIVASAQARGVPLISYRQLLDWTDARNASSIGSLSWSAGQLSFAITAAPGARGLRALLPMDGRTGQLTGITRAGLPVGYTVITVKGIRYAMIAASTGAFRATYS